MSSVEPAKIQNLYVAKPTTQERPCFICSKFTNIVLTSADNSNSDWFYTCRVHLGDFNFCSKLGQKSAKATPAPKKENLADRPPESDSVVELINGIGSAWKSWRGSKKDEDKKDDDKDKKEDTSKEEEKKQDKEEEEKEKEQEIKQEVAQPTVQQPVRFILQRDYFYVRQREFLKKQQKKQASEKLKTLQFPEVPKELPSLRK
jgi:hypothetical protein